MGATLLEEEAPGGEDSTLAQREQAWCTEEVSISDFPSLGRAEFPSLGSRASAKSKATAWGRPSQMTRSKAQNADADAPSEPRSRASSGGYSNVRDEVNAQSNVLIVSAAVPSAVMEVAGEVRVTQHSREHEHKNEEENDEDDDEEEKEEKEENNEGA